MWSSASIALLSEFSAQSHTAPDCAKFHAMFSVGVAMLAAETPAFRESWTQRAEIASAARLEPRTRSGS